MLVFKTALDLGEHAGNRASETITPDCEENPYREVAKPWTATGPRVKYCSTATNSRSAQGWGGAGAHVLHAAPRGVVLCMEGGSFERVCVWGVLLCLTALPRAPCKVPGQHKAQSGAKVGSVWSRVEAQFETL